MKNTRTAAIFCALALAVAGCGDDDDTTLVPDGGAADASTDATTMVDAGAPAEHLAQTDLYSNFAARTINPALIEYTPAHALWSDGALKRRWMSLPAGAKIDTSDMNHWRFPVGTRFYKEFAAPSGNAIYETRLIEVTGPDQFRMVSFVWDAAQTDAMATPDGALDINGSQHDAPSSADCRTCHRGEPGRILGFSAMQLSTPVGATSLLSTLTAQNKLSNAPASSTGYPVPGNATESAAIGYLHANCGHCHNPDTPVYNQTQMVLRYDITATTVATTNAYVTAVGQDLTSAAYYSNPAHASEKRITPGNHMLSAIWVRMNARGNNDQMPPQPFTELQDSAATTGGLAKVTAWIDSLTP